MSGLDKLLKGLVRYQAALKPQFAKRLADFNKDPSMIKGIMFSCMDARVNVARILSHDLGEAFEVRNAGNFIPHFSTISPSSISTEPGGLELACLSVMVPDILVFGHSDCKAMIALHSMAQSSASPETSPLKMWLGRHGGQSLEKLRRLTKDGGPLKFHSIPQSFEATIDMSDKLPDHDKLSQINTLQQLENISSYPFLTDRLKSGQLRTHAIWLDLTSADVHVFNRASGRFQVVDEQNVGTFV